MSSGDILILALSGAGLCYGAFMVLRGDFRTRD